MALTKLPSSWKSSPPFVVPYCQFLFTIGAGFGVYGSSPPRSNRSFGLSQLPPLCGLEYFPPSPPSPPSPRSPRPVPSTWRLLLWLRISTPIATTVDGILLYSFYIIRIIGPSSHIGSPSSAHHQGFVSNSSLSPSEKHPFKLNCQKLPVDPSLLPCSPSLPLHPSGR